DIQAQQQAVAQAQAMLDKARTPYTQYDIAQQQHVVAASQDALDQAQNPYTIQDVQTAQAGVDQAHAALAARRNPYTDKDVATAQAQVDQAQAALQQAQLQVQQTRVLAPVDSVVSNRMVSPGALVTPQNVVIALVPPTVQVNGSVDDTQLGSVQ